MVRRPDLFSRDAFQKSLRQQGCAESFVSPITSDFRLFVPVILRELGPEKIVTIMEQARPELKLGAQRPAWETAAKYIVGWAEEQIEQYKAGK